MSCSNQFGQCSNDVRENVSKYEGKSIREAKRSISRELSNSPRIEEYAVRYMIPNKLSVSCIEKTAEFALENEEYQTIALLDDEGFVMQLVEESVLPSVTTTDTLPDIGEKVSDRVRFAIELARQIRPLYENSKFTIKDQYLEVVGIDDYTVFFPLQGDKDVLLGSFTLVLSRLKQNEEEFRIEEGKTISEIDLRFKNPVLR